MLWVHFFMIVVQIILDIAMLCFGAWVAAMLIKGFFSSEVPFVPALKRVLPTITRAMPLSRDSVFYDLGCGDGRILRAFREKYSDAAYIGIEKSFPIYLLAYLYNRKLLGPRFRIKRGDFFKTDLSGATHVFMYPIRGVAQRLLPKFEKELKPGTIVVSIDHPFEKRKYDQKIDLPNGRYQICRTAYVYRF